MYKNIIERIIYLRFVSKGRQTENQKNFVNKARKNKNPSVSEPTHDNKCIIHVPPFRLRKGQP